MLALVACLPLAFAQDPRGRILGRVVDTSGALVPGISITVTNVETGVVNTVVSNQSGNYLAPFLNPGTYRVTSENAGFKRFERSAVDVRVGDAINIEVVLEPGAITESITVNTETPLLETTESGVGQVVDRKRLLDLPLAGGNPYYLLQLTPGIISTNASSHGWFPHALDSISGIAAAGTRARSSQFAMDGNPVMTQNGQVSYSPPPEMVQEMKVQTAPFDASLGGFSGANINIVTRSGTNQFKGDFWFSHYSRPLTTRNFFVNRFIFDPTTGPITEAKKKSQWPPVLTNRYRATIAGPVIRNRTFFVYGFDMLDRKRPVTGTNSVPTEAQRRGDFSELLKLGSRYQIYDPNTTVEAPGGRFSRQPFPGNILPSSRIDPVAAKIAALYPTPNDFTNPEARNNFIQPIGTRVDYFSHSFRADHTFTDKHRIYGSLAYSNLDEPGNQRFAPATSVGQIEDRMHRGITVDDVYVLTPNTILNVRYGLTRYMNTVSPLSLGTDLGALGFDSSLVNALDKSLQTLPAIQIQGLQTLSQAGGYTSATNYHTINGNITQNRGNHSLRFGGELRIFQENRTTLGNYVPLLDFQAAYTRGPLDNSPTAPIGQGMASFLLGIPTGGGRDLNASYAQQSRYMGIFLHDDWKVSPSLTLNIGLRWEVETPTTERYNRTIRGFDGPVTNPIEAQARARYATAPIPELPASQFRTPGGLLFSGVNGVSRGLWNADRNNFAPRFGFAWKVLPKTVVRGGYGIFYELIGATVTDVNQQGFSQRTNLIPSIDNGMSYVASLKNPFPAGFLQPAGASAGLKTYLGRSPAFFDPSRPNGYMQRWSLGFQHELPLRVLLDVGYVGNRGTKLGIDRDFSVLPREWWSTSPSRDQARIDFLTANFNNPFFGLPEFDGSGIAGRTMTRAQLLTTYPHFGSVSSTQSQGYSWYHSLQARIEKRYSRGFTIGMSYTWSKFMEAVELLNDFDAFPTEVISPQDRPHHVSVTGIWELPVGKGRALLASAPAWQDGILGGWQVQAIYQYQTGAPIGFGNVIYNGASLDDLFIPSGQRSVERWFNTAGFERDPAKQLAWNVRTF
ncbi:MAG: TonB-dependent receptor, partial [Bryobacteraceae bacterium]|nr:TonB-dependent receptor [Bryobacteraceae bacterium]